MLRVTCVVGVLLFVLLCGLAFFLPGRAGSETPDQRKRALIVRKVEWYFNEALDRLETDT